MFYKWDGRGYRVCVQDWMIVFRAGCVYRGERVWMCTGGWMIVFRGLGVCFQGAGGATGGDDPPQHVVG